MTKKLPVDGSVYNWVCVLIIEIWNLFDIWYFLLEFLVYPAGLTIPTGFIQVREKRIVQTSYAKANNKRYDRVGHIPSRGRSKTTTSTGMNSCSTSRATSTLIPLRPVLYQSRRTGNLPVSEIISVYERAFLPQPKHPVPVFGQSSLPAVCHGEQRWLRY